MSEWSYRVSLTYCPDYRQ